MNGDITFLDLRQFRAKLLDGQSASANGVWVEVSPGLTNRSAESTSLEEGATDATIDIMVSNAEAKPADGTDGPIQATMTVASSLMATWVGGHRWVKAKKTQGTTPVATTVTLVCTGTKN